MIRNLHTLLAPALMDRITLALNHVIGGEAVAIERLKPHAGRTVEVLAIDWPALLPPPPALAFRVSPAGLLEWCGQERSAAPDLALRVDAANPMLLMTQVLAGGMPTVEIDGDAALAADVNWLMQNLRWDVAADLERVAGPVAAQQLVRLGSGLAGAVRVAVQTAGGLRERLRPRA